MTLGDIKNKIASLKKKRSEARQSTHESRLARFQQEQRLERERETTRRRLNEEAEQERRTIQTLVTTNAIAHSELLDLYGIDYREQMRAEAQAARQLQQTSVGSYTREMLRQDSFANRILTPIDISGEDMQRGVAQVGMSSSDLLVAWGDTINPPAAPIPEPPKKRVSIIHIEPIRVIDLGE